MKIKGIRWWMVGLMTVGLIINYLARNTLSVAAPTLMTDLSISTEQYSHIVVAWQVCYALMQPIAGYVIDAIGTKMGLEDQYAFAGDAGVAQGQQAFLVEVRQGRGRDVETQVHGAGDLVDVLTASALGADGCQLDLGVGEVHVVGYHQHFLIGPWGGGVRIRQCVGLLGAGGWVHIRYLGDG